MPVTSGSSITGNPPAQWRRPQQRAEPSIINQRIQLQTERYARCEVRGESNRHLASPDAEDAIINCTYYECASRLYWALRCLTVSQPGRQSGWLLKISHTLTQNGTYVSEVICGITNQREYRIDSSEIHLSLAKTWWPIDKWIPQKVQSDTNIWRIVSPSTKVCL